MPLHRYDAAAFAALSQRLLSEPVFEQTLQSVVDLAVETIDGCDHAGISLRRGGKVETPASTHPLVDQLDQDQYDLREGTCLDAVFVDDTYVIVDMTRENRWPNWTPRAAAAGVQSMLSVRLATPSKLVGGLNLYSKRIGAYGEDEVLTAHIYAQHASSAIATSDQIDGLATGMQTRHMIGVAQGLLMQRYELSQEQAFQFLRRISQDANVKLRDIATRIINDAAENGRLP